MMCWWLLWCIGRRRLLPRGLSRLLDVQVCVGRHASDVPQPLSEVQIAGEWGVWESVAGFMPSKPACMGMNGGSTGQQNGVPSL